MNVKSLESWLKDAPVANAISVSIYRQKLKSCLNELKRLQAENKQLRKDVSGWLNWCYYLPKDWKPKSMIEKSTQILKKYGVEI